jgi:N-acetylmuramoyl-L-alanine amidase
MVKRDILKSFVFLWSWVFLSVALFADINMLKRVEIANNELRLVFSSWLNKGNIDKMVLNDPPRQVIDINNARLDTQGSFPDLSAKGVNSLRISQYKDDVVRIVIETDRPYVCNHYQPMMSRSYYQIPLPIKSTYLKEEMVTAYVKEVPQEIEKQRHDQKKPEVLVQREEKIEEEVSFFPSFFSTGSSKGPKKDYTVVIDAGHGGHDSGAVGEGRYMEKVFVLQMAKQVEKQLKKEGYTVKMTRSDDRFIELKNRTKIANRHKADIFISIHANAAPNQSKYASMYGVETFFLQMTRSERAKNIAAKENSVVLNANDFLSNDVILNSVLSGPKIELSHKLAIDVQTKIVKNARHQYSGVKDGGVRPAPFWVLVGAQMPSILVEVGYISNPAERARLFSPAYQKVVAKGISEGVDSYLVNREKEFE